MIPPDRNRTTSTPGVVDLPAPRRTTAEVTLERKKKAAAANARVEAKRLAEAQVAEVESRAVVAQKKGSGVNGLGPKRSHKRPASNASLLITNLIAHLLKLRTSDTGGFLEPQA